VYQPGHARPQWVSNMAALCCCNSLCNDVKRSPAVKLLRALHTSARCSYYANVHWSCHRLLSTCRNKLCEPSTLDLLAGLPLALLKLHGNPVVSLVK
jgi:hypothetical protein